MAFIYFSVSARESWLFAGCAFDNHSIHEEGAFPLLISGGMGVELGGFGRCPGIEQWSWVTRGKEQEMQLIVGLLIPWNEAIIPYQGGLN